MRNFILTLIALWHLCGALIAAPEMQFLDWVEVETSYARSRKANDTRWEPSGFLMSEIVTGGDAAEKAGFVRLFIYPDPWDTFYHEELLIDNIESVLETRFNRNLPTKIFVHGFGHGYNCSFPQELKNIYLAYQFPVNLVVVDWGPIAMSADAPLLINKFKNYIVAAENVPIVGTRIGDFISHLSLHGYYDPALVHIIGFSLGAHAAGHAGQRVWERTGRNVGRITGLDPAGPLYTTGLVGRHLSRLDADYVDFIHTDMGQSGTVYSLGHSNYFVNGGKPKQPGCISTIASYETIFEKIPVALLGSCSHSTAPLYYAQSVARYHDFIFATHCSNYVAYQAGFCILNDIEIFGEFSLPQTRGDYYLELAPQERSGQFIC